MDETPNPALRDPAEEGSVRHSMAIGCHTLEYRKKRTSLSFDAFRALPRNPGVNTVSAGSDAARCAPGRTRRCPSMLESSDLLLKEP